MKIKLLLAVFLSVIAYSSYATEYLIKHPVNGLVAKKDNSFIGDYIVFRHVNHDTQGWADIVIAKVKSPQFINSETTYRNAAINAGFEGYFTRTNESDNFRCKNQIYKPPTVPELDLGCSGIAETLKKYILFKKPDDITNMPTHLFRPYDEKYWTYGAGRWIQDRGTNHIPLEVGITNYLSAVSGVINGLPTRQLNKGDWIFTLDNNTNKR